MRPDQVHLATRAKAKAEVGVQVVQRWIVAALRKRKFFSLAEVNQAIGELLARLNERPFRKRPGNRATLFAQLDRPALKPLPPPAISLENGKRRVSTSTITLKWSGTSTACRTRWCTRKWTYT